MHARNKCASSDTRTGKHARASLTCQYPFRRCRTSTIFPGTHHSLRLDSMSAGEGEAGQQGAADRGGAATRAAEHCGSRAATYCSWPSPVKGMAQMLELKQQRQWTRTPKNPKPSPCPSVQNAVHASSTAAQRSVAQHSAAQHAPPMFHARSPSIRPWAMVKLVSRSAPGTGGGQPAQQVSRQPSSSTPGGTPCGKGG